MATTLATIIAQARIPLQDRGILATPALPTVTPQGVTGATAYSYKIVAIAPNGVSAASAAGSTSTGNATLSTTNFNRVVWVAITGATAYRVYRTVGGATTGLIATAGNTLTLDDTGLTGDASTAPATAAGTAYWSDDELLQLALRGCHDMWRTMIDLHEEHFLTIDTTNVSLAASTATLTGVPADTFRVVLIQPADTTSTSSSRGVVFKPANYNSPEFRASLATSAVDPTSGAIVYFALVNAGSPVAAPSVYVAPQLSSAVTLRFVYIPTLSSSLTVASNNPIPGESDHALIAWVVAHALAKDREDRSPDPNWLAIYSTEKTAIMTASTPRQEQEPYVVRGVFDDEDVW